MENIKIFEMPEWPLDPTRGKPDYELIDSGGYVIAQKLERFGPYVFIRPEHRAAWERKSPEKWVLADAEFKVEGGKGGWKFLKKIPPRWEMSYKNIKFYAEPTPFRHMGVFPEQASHWDFIEEKIKKAGRPVKVLNLFGYTGIASLVAAAAGAEVTHVDASKKIITWANENQKLSGLEDKPIRWIVDDALKFLKREIKRGAKYDGIIIDPPKFGRGPKGEVWKVEELMTPLLQECRAVLSEDPLFMIATLYSIQVSSVTMYEAFKEIYGGLGGKVEAGELAIRENGGRLLSVAITAKWFQV